MNLEINKPELLRRVNAHIDAGHFHDADELIEKALDALEEKNSLPTRSASEDSGAALPAVFKSSRYTESEVAPARRSPDEVRAWLDELASLSDKIPSRPGETFSREMIYQDHA